MAGTAQAGAPSVAIAIVALLVNLLFLPGLGSIIGGRTQEGVWQLVLSVGTMFLVFFLVITIVGILLLPVVLLLPLAAWVWALVTGIRILQDAQAAERARAQV